MNQSLAVESRAMAFQLVQVKSKEKPMFVFQCEVEADCILRDSTGTRHRAISRWRADPQTVGQQSVTL